MRAGLGFVMLALMWFSTAASAANPTPPLSTEGDAPTADDKFVSDTHAILPVAFDARILGDQQRTRFTMDISRPVEFTIFRLAAPYRLVIDLPAMNFALPPALGSSGGGLISALRSGSISRGKSRVVLDLTGPVQIDNSFVMPAGSAQSPQLVVELVPSDRDKFLAAARADQLAGKNASVPERPAEKPSSTSAADWRPVMVLDPGHGGVDSGASAGGLNEKDITLAFSRLLGAKLAATGRYHSELTRDDDTYVRLGDRVEFARKERAQLFIAIHADAFHGPVRGATVYTLSRHASSAIAASIAAVENSSDILAGLDTNEEDAGEVAGILSDLARRETMSFSSILARALVNDLRPITFLVKNPYQQAAFVVLRAPDVPSVLLELGYLSNLDDRKLLGSREWRERAAAAVVKAIDDYFDTRSKGAAVQ